MNTQTSHECDPIECAHADHGPMYPPGHPAMRETASAGVTYHVLPYETWRQLGRTDCCGRLITELPKADACGPDQRGRESGQRRCAGA